MKNHTYDATAYYFTAAADGERIASDARIDRAHCVRDMLARMQDCCVSEVTGYVEGTYGDCWAKTISEPTQEDYDWWSNEYGLPRDCFIARAPGTHPGGKLWWVELAIPIYVPVFKAEE